MKITVKFLSPLGSRLGRAEECIKCAPTTKARDFFRLLGKKIGQEFFQLIYDPDLDKLKANVGIGLKRGNIPRYQRLELFDGMDTELQPNDSLIVFLAMGGG